MLSAAVAGEVFTSPSSESIFAAIKTVAGKPGALLVVKNYTGDRLNFGVAAEMARAEGISVETVIVSDDIALAATQHSSARRGIAGTVFVHKIAGAAAAEGKGLADVTTFARAAAASVATIGVSLSAGTIPAIGKPSFILAETEVEMGLGIHGEPGVKRVRLQSADVLTDEMIEAIVATHRLGASEQVAVMINNLGATTNMELAIVAGRALSNLRSRKLAVERVFVGTFMSSLEMAGVSISILRLDDARLRLLDALTAAPAWPNASRQAPSLLQDRTTSFPQSTEPDAHLPVLSEAGKRMRLAIEAACGALLEAQEQLTELDRIVGDGDLGITMTRGAEAVTERLSTYPLDDPAKTLKALGQTLQRVLGGSSGPLYGILFLRAGSVLEVKGEHSPAAWAAAIEEACGAVSNLGGASVGDRTMLDALIPFAGTFLAELQKGVTVEDALQAGVSEAERGAESTARMKPRRGRSSYLGERALGHPDPGAVAVAIWLRAVTSTLA
jgi:dihydroxyacetone kinase